MARSYTADHASSFSVGFYLNKCQKLTCSLKLTVRAIVIALKWQISFGQRTLDKTWSPSDPVHRGRISMRKALFTLGAIRVTTRIPDRDWSQCARSLNDRALRLFMTFHRRKRSPSALSSSDPVHPHQSVSEIQVVTRIAPKVLESECD